MISERRKVLLQERQSATSVETLMSAGAMRARQEGQMTSMKFEELCHRMGSGDLFRRSSVESNEGSAASKSRGSSGQASSQAGQIPGCALSKSECVPRLSVFPEHVRRHCTPVPMRNAA